MKFRPCGGARVTSFASRAARTNLNLGSLRELDARVASAEEIPFLDRSFDVVLAQLVVQFMSDPVAGLREMARVAKPGGVVAACVWDAEGRTSPLSPFWRVVKELDPEAAGESGRAGAREGHLGELFREAGLAGVEESPLAVSLQFETFEDWWAPFELGVGPPGAYIASLDADRRGELRELARRRTPDPPFTVTGRAWAARSGSR